MKVTEEELMVIKFIIERDLEAIRNSGDYHEDREILESIIDKIKLKK